MRTLGRAFLAILAVTVASCVDTSAPDLPYGAAGNGGLSQRLWDRYVLHDVQTNALPALVSDTGVVRLRIYADTLSFVLATGEFRETAIVGQFNADGSETILTLTSPRGATYGHSVADGVVFPSLLFGSATATLSGATRIQPFSTTLQIASNSATYSISF